MPGINTRIAKQLRAALLLCVMAPGFLPAQQAGNSERAAIEIISIEHRDPIYVRAQLMPSLDPRGDIGLVDNKLIIASTAGNLQQLKNLIADTDVPARRLVVSVDFDYGSPRPGNAGQQSSQALEGDPVSFADGVPPREDALPVQPAVDTSVAAPAPSQTSTQAQIVITSTVRGDNVEADVEMFNIPGFSGRHPLTLVLGQWYVINPVAEPGTAAEEPIGFELVEELPMPGTQPFESAQAAVTPTPTRTAPVAVRVDVLP